MKVLIKLGLLSICCVAFFVIYATQQKQSSKNPDVSEILRTISKNDYEELDKLFRCLVFENYFAYTLFGTKPMTYHGSFYDVLQRKRTKDNEGAYIFLTNWKTWEKYSKLPEFDLKNFVFIEEKRPELFGVHFINKRNTIRCIEENIGIFKEVLGNEITPETVLQSIINSQDIYASLNDSQILYGILFGFGAENAKAFHQKFDLDLPLPDPTPFHNEDPDQHLLPLPYFMTFHPNEETVKLRKQYTLDRERILSIYSKGNFLEITLTRLLAP